MSVISKLMKITQDMLSSSLFYCSDKTTTKSSLEVYIWLTFSHHSHHKGKLDPQPRKQELKQKPRRNVAYWLAPLGLSVNFLMSIIKKMATQTYPPCNLMKFLLPDASSLCTVDKTNQYSSS